MGQTIHILKKDIRHLRLEIGVVLVMAASFGGVGHALSMGALMSAAAAYLIVRVIQAEPIPGDTQFWITRPYRWTHLLAAKLAFIVLFVNLPVFGAQWVIFVRDGFSVTPNLPGLLWGFLLAFFGVAVPIAALATLTPGLGQFILTGILFFTIAQSIVADFRIDPWPDEVAWIRFSILAVLVILIGAWTLLEQYRTRRTFRNRVTVVAVVVLGLVGAFYTPLEWGLALQSRLSREGFESTSFRIELDPSLPPRSRTSLGEQLVRVNLPFVTRNTPDGVVSRSALYNLTFVGRDGQRWEPPAVFGRQMRPFRENMARSVGLPKSLVDAWRDSPVAVQGTFYLTVFGNAQEEAFVLSKDGVELSRGLQCFSQESRSGVGVLCRIPFRRPSFAMSVRVGDEEIGNISPVFSYSPFPAGIDLNQRWQGQLLGSGGVVRLPEEEVTESGRSVRFEYVSYGLIEGQQVTLIVRDRVAYLRRGFEMTIDLDDFVVN